MDAGEYQELAHSFVTVGADNWQYALHGLMEEVGELAGKFAKYQRKHFYTPGPTYTFQSGRKSGLFSKCSLREHDREFLKAMEKEAGDVCWMLSELLTQYGLRLDRVMERNIRKLDDRKARGVIVGSGDYR